MSNREANYWEGHPRAQAATDAILGGIVGTILGYGAGVVLLGVSVAASADEEGVPVAGIGGTFAAATLPWLGGITGAWLGGRRERAGFSEAQRKKAGKGAAVGGIFGSAAAGAGTFYATERSPNIRKRRNALMR